MVINFSLFLRNFTRKPWRPTESHVLAGRVAGNFSQAGNEALDGASAVQTGHSEGLDGRRHFYIISSNSWRESAKYAMSDYGPPEDPWMSSPAQAHQPTAPLLLRLEVRTFAAHVVSGSRRHGLSPFPEMLGPPVPLLCGAGLTVLQS